MSLIILADDSPHAQRMGERILREEGFDVVLAADGETALERLQEIDPDLVLVDAHLVGRTGFQICEAIRSDSRLRHTRVVLTAGAHEPLDEAEAARVGADSIVRRPFEASVVISTIRPLVAEAEHIRNAHLAGDHPLDPEHVRAAVTLALDAAMPELIDTITRRVLAALGVRDAKAR